MFIKALALPSVGNGYINEGMDNIVLKVASSAVLGGTISEIGGGKFANGAVTGAYSMLYNEIMHLNLTRKFNEQLKKTKDYFTSRRLYYEQMMSELGGMYSAGDLIVDGSLSVATVMLSEFASLVAENSMFDLKNNPKSLFSDSQLKGQLALYNNELFRSQDFGNYNFGVAAKAFGLTLNFSQLGAGLYQIYRGASDWRWIKSHFDDPTDSKMIERGYNHFK